MASPDSYLARQLEAQKTAIKLLRDIVRSDSTDDIAYLLEDLDEACEEME